MKTACCQLRLVLFLAFAAGALRLPTIPLLHNEGNYICSLSKVARWLGAQAEELGVDIFPATPAAEVLYGDSGEVVGVATRYAAAYDVPLAVF